jgi:hypothetical protein
MDPSNGVSFRRKQGQGAGCQTKGPLVDRSGKDEIQEAIPGGPLVHQMIGDETMAGLHRGEKALVRRG